VDVTSNVLTKATVLFDADPTRRLVVFWKDEKPEPGRWRSLSTHHRHGSAPAACATA
jgi:hypothetical protein